jgi:DNA-binding CsgD family transcriptional regulator
VLHKLGHTLLHLGDVARAFEHVNESMSLQQSQRNEPGMAECLIGFAALAIARDLPAAAARLLSAASAHGVQPARTVWAATRMEYERALGLASARLGEPELQSEQAAGATLSLAQAVAYGHRILQQVPAGRPARARAEDELTARERQVAALIARARSNDEIAEALFLSKRTVEKHIANIRSKLGFTQRAQIVRWAIETGLLEPDTDDTLATSTPLT